MGIQEASFLNISYIYATIPEYSLINLIFGWFQLLCGLRYVWSWTTETLGWWVQILFKIWVYVLVFLCYAVLC